MIIELLYKEVEPFIISLLFIYNNTDILLRSIDKAEIILEAQNWENLIE